MTIEELAAKKAMPAARPIDSRFARLLQEVLTPPTEREPLSSAPRVITQADVDREVALLREAKACKEAKGDMQQPGEKDLV